MMPLKPLKLLSSMAPRALLATLIQRFQEDRGWEVIPEAAGGVDVAKRLQAGETADVVVLAAGAIGKLITSGHLLAESRRDLARSGISVAVRAGAQRPDLSTENAVREAVLAARTLAYSTGPSGVYLENLFERWGILETVRGRIVVPRPGIPVGSLVASGEVALGFQQLSELMSLPGIDVVGALPPAIQCVTVFTGAVCARAADAARAQALVDFLADPAGEPIKRQHGMEGS